MPGFKDTHWVSVWSMVLQRARCAAGILQRDRWLVANRAVRADLVSGTWANRYLFAHRKLSETGGLSRIQPGSAR
jgi:hypothetical protein